MMGFVIVVSISRKKSAACKIRRAVIMKVSMEDIRASICVEELKRLKRETDEVKGLSLFRK